MRTALEAKPQQHYFTSREIRGLFDWTDPAEGETRRLLVESHGEQREEDTVHNALEDGIDEASLRESGVVGMSNFSALFTSLQQSKEGDECSVQIAEMRKKLADSETRIGQASEIQQATEGNLQTPRRESARLPKSSRPPRAI